MEAVPSQHLSHRYTDSDRVCVGFDTGSEVIGEG